MTLVRSAMSLDFGRPNSAFEAAFAKVNEVEKALAHFSGNKLSRTVTNLVQIQ